MRQRFLSIQRSRRDEFFFGKFTDTGWYLKCGRAFRRGNLRSAWVVFEIIHRHELIGMGYFPTLGRVTPHGEGEASGAG